MALEFEEDKPLDNWEILARRQKFEKELRDRKTARIARQDQIDARMSPEEEARILKNIQRIIEERDTGLR